MKNKLKTWQFGINNNALVDLVLIGNKTATTYIYNGDIDKVGTESILIYDDKTQACITKTVKNVILDFKNVDWDLAKLEGENDNFEEWKENHFNYFKSIDNNFTEDTKVVVEVFEVVKNLKKGNNIKVYIDFDGTLFDTDKYTKDFMYIFDEYGIDIVVFNEVKNVLFSNENLFNLDIITDYFIENYDIDLELKNKINNLLNTSYLYSEVINCLEQLINNGYELYLLTYGNVEFQKIKINASNIDKYFKEIIITSKNKSELNLDYKNSIFIDNNPIEVERIYNSMAKTVIRIRRNSDRYTKLDCSISNIIECENFYQVVKFLGGD